MKTIPIIIFIFRTLNIFFLIYIMLTNCSTITIKDFYKLIFYIDLAYRFISFASTVIINLWKKCLKIFHIYVLILMVINYILYIIVIYCLISNFLQFNSFYYDCPYLRLNNANEINNNTYKYKRTCINYKLKEYICFYNSTNEYINKFCDGVLCKKDKNIADIINSVNCENIYIDNIIQTSKNSNIIDYINKTEYKNELYLCKRKYEIDKNNKLIGNKCPDNSPIKSYIFSIYEYICSCFLECLFFIFLYFYLKESIKKIEIELKKERQRREERIQQINYNNNCNKSDKEETKNTNQIQNNIDENVENEYDQGERILTIGIEQESPKKSESEDIKSHKSHKSNIHKETNKKLIIIKSSINEDENKENEEENKDLPIKSKKFPRFNSEDKPINFIETETNEELKEEKK